MRSETAGKLSDWRDHPDYEHDRAATLMQGVHSAAAGLKPMAAYDAGEDWRTWVRKNFPAATSAPFSRRHERLWEWFESLTPGVKPRAHVEIWPRGGAKSSTAELGCARLGVKRTRKFVLYVSATQDQANKHVQAISSRFEALGVSRALSRYGNSLGWRIDLIRTSHGFNVLALGLDAAARGVKLGDDRPDMIVLDDVDERHDTAKVVAKKIATITDSILPAGASDAAVLFVQNRIHDQSIATQLATGSAEFLLDREVFEEPAVRGMVIEPVEMPDGTRRYRIAAGEPTWEGQSLATCEGQLNEWGRGAFLREAQHETALAETGLWSRARDIDPFREAKASQDETDDLQRIVVAIDPNATSGESSDDAGIVVAGIRRRLGVTHGVLLEDATVSGGPKTWATAAVAAYHRWGADVLVAESNNGGEMVAITIGTVPKAPPVKLIHASRGKLTRAEPVQKLAEDGRIHHAGEFPALERELCTWSPGDPSPNRLDAYVWAITELMLQPEPPPPPYRPPSTSQVNI